jgi:GntR family transcriptional regulator/MocR family aminotransferase
MRDLLFPLRHDGATGLQKQLRAHLVRAIADGRLSTREPLPSCRRLAQMLGVSRNTVVLTYQALTDEGFLISKERVGFFVNEDQASVSTKLDLPQAPPPVKDIKSQWDWYGKFRIHPSRERLLDLVANWRDYPYPFVYGQADPELFPVTNWRIASRQALSLNAIHSWAQDRFYEDDPELVEEIRTSVLARRGVRAEPDEILITLGAQNALYLTAQLLVGAKTRVGMEDPGYPDARNIFAVSGAEIVPLPVDSEGLVVNRKLAGCDLIYVTPSHQSPTTATMPMARRVELLDMAQRNGFCLVEDDYEAETNFVGPPTSALKSMDRDQLVIYIGSFSKSLAPGLRVGYMVAAKELIAEARQLRRLMFRHPPANVQRTVAIFIASGYYDSLIHRLQRAYRERWTAMGEALREHLPEYLRTSSFGGTSFWIQGPKGLDADAMAKDLRSRGVLIEPGSFFFHGKKIPKNNFRLGFSVLRTEKIAPGIALIAEALTAAEGSLN